MESGGDGGEGVQDVGEELEDEVPACGGSCERDVGGACTEEGIDCGCGFAELGGEGFSGRSSGVEIM